MTDYLGEVYVPRCCSEALEAAIARIDAAASAMRADGTPIHHMRSIFVPPDETWFCLCAAPSEEAVLEAGRRAEIRFERVREAIQIPTGVERAHDSGRRSG